METQICISQDTRREKKDALYPIKLRIYYRGKTVLHPTIYDLSKEDFEKLNAKRISDSLGEIRDHLKRIELEATISANKIIPFNFQKFFLSYIRNNTHFRNREKPITLNSEEQFASNEIPEEWKKKFSIFREAPSEPDYISEIYLLIIKSLLFQARVSTASSYQTSYNSFKKFRGNQRLCDITPLFLKEYEGWMINKMENSKTTVGINARVLRAVINEAIERKLMSREDYPFGRRRYRIPTSRNIKKALDKNIIAQLYYSKVKTGSQQKAKDFWFFSFYGNGMNIKDILHLKYKNIKGEYLVFERAKTEQATRGSEPIIISCFINQDMLNIIEKWGNRDKNSENYIFPILSLGLSPIRQFQIKELFIRFINKNIDKICKNEKIEIKIKTMETRHSASTLMKNAGVSPHFIKESLGHASLKTTENYLAGFENEQRKEFAKVLDEFKFKTNDKKFI